MEWYFSIGVVFMVLGYLAGIIYAGYEFARYAKFFIKGQKHSNSEIIEYISDNCMEPFLVLGTLLGPFFCIIGWPLALILIIGFGILYGGRHIYNNRKED